LLLRLNVGVTCPIRSKGVVRFW